MNRATAAIMLDLNRVEELFQAPDADPFSPNEITVLGQSGMDYLRKRFAREWPKRRVASQLLIRLPSRLPAPDQATGDETTTEQLAHVARAAIRRYCIMHMQAIRAARRLQMAQARRELLIALAVTVIALVLLAWCITTEPSGFRGYALIIATLLAVYAASLSIWDALESLFFDWTPFAMDDLACQWICGLEVQVVIQPGQILS